MKIPKSLAVPLTYTGKSSILEVIVPPSSPQFRTAVRDSIEENHALLVQGYREVLTGSGESMRGYLSIEDKGGTRRGTSDACYCTLETVLKDPELGPVTGDVRRGNG